MGVCWVKCDMVYIMFIECLELVCVYRGWDGKWVYDKGILLFVVLLVVCIVVVKCLGVYVGFFIKVNGVLDKFVLVG